MKIAVGATARHAEGLANVDARRLQPLRTGTVRAIRVHGRHDNASALEQTIGMNPLRPEHGEFLITPADAGRIRRRAHPDGRL